ncbi:MAG: helix-turn-helix transcriptional regulator [Ilumatobacteraceae bacterium]|nr:helix-turn-helix transcriptional regulator [Ilumatobacteraceae bacterium]
MSRRDRIAKICGRGLDGRALRIELLAEVRSEIAFDAYVWLVTDPETCVGSAPLADVPSLADIPKVIRLKYLTAMNRWTTLPSNTAVTLVGATSGDLSRSLVWRELLRGYGVSDVMSMVFRDQYGTWAFVDLWRHGGVFLEGECEVLTDLADVATSALRHTSMPSFEHSSSTLDRHSGPAVLLLSDDLELLTQTPQADAYLRALLPTDAERAPIPAGAYNVAAQLLAHQAAVDTHPPSARVHLRDGLWVTLRAARIEKTSADAASIAVSIEPTPATERAALYARVAGLSERESELLRHLVAGTDTRELAQRLFVSEHTVQDHLKSVFAKTGVNNRRVLVARATGLT